MRTRVAPVLSVALLTSGLATTVAITPSAAAPLPDLRITTVAVQEQQVQPGGTVQVTETLKNAGKGKAGKSTTKFWLSTDQVVDRTDPKAGKRAAAKLRPRKSSEATTQVTVPTATPVGAYWVIACADATKVVKERKEKNNCTSSTTRVTVAAGGGGGGASVWSGKDPAIAVIGTGSKHLALAWPAIVAGADVKEFVLSWNGGQVTVPVGQPEAIVTGLAPSTQYDVSVAARRADGSTDPEVLSITASTAGPLQEPLDLQLTTGHPRAETVGGANQWSDPREITSEVWLRGEAWEYELQLPNAALPTDETIRMAEVTAVSGLTTTGGLVAGVTLEPSGLLLAEPAVLEIRPRSQGTAVPADVIPLVFEGNGEQAHLISMDPTSQVYRFQVSHFSGVVVMEGTDAERDALVDNAETEIDRLFNETAAALAEERRRVLTEGDVGIDPAAQEFLQAQFDAAFEHALSMLQVAATNDRVAQRAVSTALGLLRSAALLGIDVTAQTAQFHALLEQIMQNAYDAAKLRCAVNLDPREGTRMLGYSRSAQMLGVELSSSMDDVMSCVATTVELGIDASFHTWDVPQDAFICCGGAANSVAGSVKASVELSPHRNGNDLYYIGVADPVLSGLAVERVDTCALSVGSPDGDNAIPLVLTAGFNWDIDPDAPARFRVDITDWGPAGEELPYFRTGFGISYSTPTPEDGCSPPVHSGAQVWNSLPLEYGGIEQPWTIPIGTTTYTTSADPYPRVNFGADVRLSFTLGAAR